MNASLGIGLPPEKNVCLWYLRQTGNPCFKDEEIFLVKDTLEDTRYKSLLEDKVMNKVNDKLKFM